VREGVGFAYTARSAQGLMYDSSNEKNKKDYGHVSYLGMYLSSKF
jgi:hypothetical protein